MRKNILYNHISPKTGRLKIKKDYILIGDSEGNSVESPDLIDMKMQIIFLHDEIDRVDNELHTMLIWLGEVPPVHTDHAVGTQWYAPNL